MQKCMASAAAGARNNPAAADTVLALLTRWRALDGHVVHVRHLSTTPGSLFWPGQSGVEFQDALAPWAGEHVVDKNVPDAFIHPGLERWLRVRGITHLILVGVSTNISVESTARSAGNLGFVTEVAADATYAFASTDYAGTPRSAADVHAMALANLDGEFARVTSSARVLDQFPLPV